MLMEPGMWPGSVSEREEEESEWMTKKDKQRERVSAAG